MGANFIASDLDLFFNAEYGFFKGEIKAVLKISASSGDIACLPGCPAKAEEILENVGEIREIYREIRYASGAAHTVMTEAIVGCPLIRVG
jgi:hypothetical protein